MSAVIAEATPVPAAPKRKKKLIVIALAALLLLAALGGGVAFFLKKRHAAHAEEEAGGPAKAEQRSGPPTWLPLDAFVVNLADRDADRYAQIGITLEVENASAADQVKAWMPALRNSVLMVLASKTSKQLLDRDGKEQLADELRREAATAMGISVATPKPVTAEAAHEGEKADAKGDGDDEPHETKKDKAEKADKAEGAFAKNPVLRVHFSSFIIQ